MSFDIGRFHAGDEAQFGAMLDMYGPRLLNQLRRYAGPEVDATDLLQEVWLRAFAKRRAFRGDGSLLGWLSTIARTVGIEAVRRRPSVADVEVVSIAAADPGGDVLLRDALLDAINDLSERQRDVVVLRLVEGRSVVETANVLQCAEGTVKATLHQAIHRLRERLRRLDDG